MKFKKTRFFTGLGVIITTLGICLSFACNSSPVDHEFNEGEHYTTLNTAATSEPEVMIFFAPHCRPCAVLHSPLRSISH
ncbi:hypothetical protein OPW33_18495 [Vibrio europaeus]|uniref:hypothetical protein n=1 Tax=Vibrio europaeus TaxID=300876 RepID=UPI002341A9DD|nr:hypothetical protein [Vibrio europaeus]MDC5841319.1 hypothetical protein [Vibrio europaeus]